MRPSVMKSVGTSIGTKWAVSLKAHPRCLTAWASRVCPLPALPAVAFLRCACTESQDGKLVVAPKRTSNMAEQLRTISVKTVWVQTLFPPLINKLPQLLCLLPSQGYHKDHPSTRVKPMNTVLQVVSTQERPAITLLLFLFINYIPL